MKCASKREWFSWRGLVGATMATLLAGSTTASWAVVITDGFQDADRNNDSVVAYYDTDVNISGTWNVTTGDPNNPGPDENLNDKGLFEIEDTNGSIDAGDVGVIWSGIRGPGANTSSFKGNVKIVDDDVATGVELQGQLHNSGFALGYESKGTGSSMAGFFGQSVVLGPDLGNMIRVKIDIRFWQEADNPAGAANPGEIRWGLYQDTDNELGQTADLGFGTVEWGKDDGGWFDSNGDAANTPGAEGDKGIYSTIATGPAGNPDNARLKFEYNLKNINGTSNNGRIFEGSGVSNTVGSGGDTGTFATNSNDGPGGIIPSFGPHTLMMDIIRVSDGSGGSLVQVATYVDGVELLRDEIKPTDTGAAVLQPAPESFDYIAFRNSSGNVDFVFDNFMIQNMVPEPTSMLLLSLGSLLALGRNRRR